MKRWNRSSSFRSLAAFAVGVFATTLTSSAAYTLTDLGDPGWVDYVYPQSPQINNQGQVVTTWISIFPDYAGFLYSGGTLTRVPTLFDGADLPGHDNFAYDINDSGVIVGNSRINNSSDISHAYFSNAATDVTDISPFPPEEYSDAFRVTNNGLILVSGAQVYSLADNSFTPIASFLPAGATLLSVSDDGIFLSSVGGNLYTSWNGVHTPLAGSFVGSLRGFNDDGEILSVSGDTLYLLSGGVSTILGSIADLTEVNGFNDDGIAVGTYNPGIPVDPENLGSSETRAYGYIGGSLIDLNTLINPLLGYTLLSATDINDLGQITGVAFTPDGLYHPYILSPELQAVPEPATYGMMATVLLGVAVVVVRRRRAALSRLA